MTELKPCPFCGGKAGIFEIKGIDNDLLGYMVGCTEDFCEVRPSVQKALDKKCAVDLWNRRVDDE